MRKHLFLILLSAIVFIRCNTSGDNKNQNALFTLLPASKTNIDFNNELNED